jgi:hypothetical protein
LVTGPGPDAGGSKPGKDGCAHRPEKSGIDAVPWRGCVNASDENRAAAAVVVMMNVRIMDFSLQARVAREWFARAHSHTAVIFHPGE